VDKEDAALVAHKHILQTVCDMQSSLGNYYKFLQEMECLTIEELTVAHLWSLPRVTGWAAWTNQRVTGLTKRNKALHLA
jgi:hypothetical protein